MSYSTTHPSVLVNRSLEGVKELALLQVLLLLLKLQILAPQAGRLGAQYEGANCLPAGHCCIHRPASRAGGAV